MVSKEIKEIWEAIELIREALAEINSVEDYEISAQIDALDKMLEEDF